MQGVRRKEESAGRPACESATGIRDLDGDAARRLDGNRSDEDLGRLFTWRNGFLAGVFRARPERKRQAA